MIRAVYSFITNEKRIAFFRKCDDCLRRLGGGLYVKTLGQLKYILRFRKSTQILDEKELAEGEQSFCFRYEKVPEEGYEPLVSILAVIDGDVTPECGMWDTIYRQTYGKLEVHVLEKGNSLLESGLARAKGELIWIIGKDTVCDRNFLEKMVPLFRYKSVMTGLSSGKTQKSGKGLGPDAPVRYITAFDLQRHLEKGSFSVPPVQGCLFRNGTDLAAIWKKNPPGSQGSDWLYSMCRRGGVVGCTEEVLYWNRIDSKKHGGQSGTETARTLAVSQSIPGIIMACYALKSGGGEIFTIYLANALKKLGASVTLLNFGLEEEEREIADMLDSGIPLVNLRHTDDLVPVLYHLGRGIIHTHQAVVDYAVSLCLKSNPQLGKQIITLHGMYETIAREDCDRVIRTALPVCDMYAYVADKNLECFRERGKFEEEKFIKIPAGIPGGKVSKIDRDQLGIGREDFVFVLASRGIPEKGWREAIQALSRAQNDCRRRLQLVILGDGEIRESLEREAPENVHFMGTVGNVRNYFAMGDVGLLPTMYAGESCPLSVMECLMCGRPVIATDIGEIGNQLRDSQGHMAGMLLSLRQGKVDVEQLAHCMCALAEHPAVYGQLRQAAERASEKFDIDMIAGKYLQLYCRAACDYPLGELHRGHENEHRKEEE